MYNLLTYITEL